MWPIVDFWRAILWGFSDVLDVLLYLEMICIHVYYYWVRAKFFQGSDEFMSKVSAGIAAEIVLEQTSP